MSQFGFWYDPTTQSFYSDCREGPSAAHIVVIKALEYIRAGQRVPQLLQNGYSRLSNTELVLNSIDNPERLAPDSAHFLSRIARVLLELHAQAPILSPRESAALHHLISIVG